MFRRIDRRVFRISLVGLLWFAAASQLCSQEARPIQRELYVPFEDLDVLLSQAPRRVFVSRAEFEQLKQTASREPEVPPPLSTALLSADYQAQLSGGRAFMNGTLVFDVLKEGLQAIPLDFSKVGMVSAKLDGKPAHLGKEEGQVTLFVEGRGTHQLDVQMVLPLATNAAQQTLAVHVPLAPASKLAVQVPGNVEVQSGASVLSRHVDEANNLTHLELVPQAPMSIVMSLNNKQLREKNTVMANGVVVSELTTAYERLHTTMSMSVVDGAEEEFRFHIDDQLDVHSVSCDLLNRWEVVTDAGTRELVVHLRSPATDRVVISVLLERQRADQSSWTLPTFRPLKVAGYTTVVGLLVEDRLRVSDLVSEALLPIDSRVLSEAIPATLQGAAPGAPRLDAAAAFYAASPKHDLSGELHLPASKLGVSANTLITVSDSGIDVTGGFSLVPENEKLFYFDFYAPLGWDLQWVRLADGADLKFERYETSEELRIRVYLAEGVLPHTEQSVLFQAQYTPPSWLGEWDVQEIQLPAFPVVGADEQRGAVAVQVRDDLVAKPTRAQNLVVLNENEKAKYRLESIPTALAYRYSNQDWRASVELTRTAPRIIARVLSFFKIGPDAISVHAELVYLVEQARARKLAFSLPDSTPEEISIRALDGVRLKESSSREVDGRRLWTVDLAERHAGKIRLAVDFSQPSSQLDRIDLQLPTARAEQVEYQSGAMSIEGHSELETQVVQNPRAVDIGELVDADYQVGPRLLGVFGYVGTEDQLVVNVARRPIRSLPTTIVERAEMVTVVGRHGRCQTAARFRLRTQANYLESQLPADASLWSVLLDGQPALPQREGERVLIALAADTSTTMRDLQIIFETSTNSLGLRGEIEVAAPELFERIGQNVQGDAIPVADLQWQLLLPTGYHVVSRDGITTKGSTGSWTSRLIDTLWQLGGGHPGGPLAVSRMAAAKMESNEVSPQIPTEGVLPPASVSSTEAFERDPFGSVSEESAAALLGSETERRDTDAPVSRLRAAGVQAAEAEPAAPGNLKNGDGKLWALEGVRSLVIHLDEADASESSVTFSNLGTQSHSRLTLANTAQLNWLGAAAGLVVFLVGLTRVTWPARIFYLCSVALILLLLPSLFGDWGDFDSLGVRISTVFPVLLGYYLLHTLCRSIVDFLRVSGGDKAASPSSSAAKTAAVSFLVALLGTSTASVAQEDLKPPASDLPPGELVTSVDQLRELLWPEAERDAVVIPDEAIVIPYDPASDTQIRSAEKLLVPYAIYERLWNLAHPDAKLQTPELPADYAWSGAEYQATLDGAASSLRMVGRLRIEQFVDREVTIPMPLAGCVLESALVNGQPARLQWVAPVPPQESSQAAGQHQQDSSESSQFVLLSSGRGTKEIVLTLRWQVEKQGGWRSARGRLPVAPASALTLEARRPDTEVRLSGLLNQESYSLTQPQETLQTALPADGSVILQWRDRISEAQIDQGLTVESQAIFDVRSGSLHLAWHGNFRFRRGRRASFTLRLPGDYLVEKVVGGNIRGWNSRPWGEDQQVDIELLQEAAEQESLLLFLSKPFSPSDAQTTGLNVPEVLAPDAMLHQGTLTIRRSSVLELRSGDLRGLSRIDVPAENKWLGNHARPAPLPLKNYQAYRFSQPGFHLPLTAAIIRPEVTVESQSLVKISQMDTSLETRLLVTATGRPLYHLQVRLPRGLQLEIPEAPGQFQWATHQDNADSDQQTVEIYLANGQLGQFSVILRGIWVDHEISPEQPAPIPLPRIEVLDVERQPGTIVVQSDPGYDLGTQDLMGCQPERLSSVNTWLSDSQRRFAQLVVTYDQPQYSGQITIRPRQAIVRNVAVTNVKVTDRAVEETIYIEASILSEGDGEANRNSAGIDEFVFQLPAELAQAKIQAPLLRQKTVTPVNELPGAPVQIRLELQDAITGQFAVIVEHDHLLAPNSQPAPLPIIETGETIAQLITLENASRDELTVDRLVSCDLLDQQQLWQQRRIRTLGGQSSKVYRVNLQRAATTPPLLAYSTKAREVVETSGARIGLSQSLLVLDDLGAYRATHEFRVENRTEPFLEVALPQDARLWTVRVAGESVKPSTVPGSPDHVRVPLIKTAEGDLDYAVVLKYGGKLQRPGRFRQIDFPFLKAVNVNVELSQVRLRLPPNFRWLNFAGSMGRVQSEGELQAGWLSFRTRQISELTELLSSSGKMYSKMRAQNNLQQLEAAIEQQNLYFDSSVSQSDNRELRRQRDANKQALQRAQQQVESFQNQNSDSQELTGNRYRLSDLFGQQAGGKSFNVIDELGDNFATPSQAAQPDSKPLPPSAAASFDNTWLRGNRLDTRDAVESLRELSLEDQQAQAGKSIERSKQRIALEQTQGLVRSGKVRAPDLAKQASQGKALSKAADATQKELLGDYSQQAEKYNQRLQQQSFEDGVMLGRNLMDMAQRNLANTPQLPSAYYLYDDESRQYSPPAAAESSRATLGLQSQSGGYGGVANAPQRQGMAGEAIGGGMGGFGTSSDVAQQNRGRSAANGALLPNLSLVVPAPNNSGLGESGGIQREMSGGQTTIERDAYLASLDVELPLRGQEFLFTTPGGDLRLSAQSVSADFVGRILTTIAIGGLGLLLGLLYRIVRALLTSRVLRRCLAGLLGLIGLGSILLGILPVYGLLALGVAMVLFIPRQSSMKPVPVT